MISPQVTMALAQAKAEDLRRAGDAHRRTQPRAQPRWPVAANRSVTLRFGSPCDDRALARLAALDSAERLALPVLLAEVDGRVVAALALSDGICIADPFYPTADLLDLLRARAAQLEHAPRTMRSGRLRSWSRRRTPAWG